MRPAAGAMRRIMPVTINGGLSFCGRELKPKELDLIRQVTRDFSNFESDRVGIHDL